METKKHTYKTDEVHYVQISEWSGDVIDDFASCILDPQGNSNSEKKGGLFLSGLPLEKFYQNLIDYNIKAVVTIYDGNIKYPEEIKHLFIRLDDWYSEEIGMYFDKVINFVNENISQGNVLIHCFAGVSRSSTMTIAYLMKIKKWNFKKTFDYVKKRRPIIQPNSGFEQQLKKYEEVLGLK